MYAIKICGNLLHWLVQVMLSVITSHIIPHKSRWMCHDLHGKHSPSGIVVACVCLCTCPCVCMCNYHELVSAKSKLEPPNLDNRCKTYIPVVGVIHLDLLGHINKIQFAYYDDVVMGMIVYQITSLTVVYSTVYSDAHKKNIKAPRHWPLWGKFIGDPWIPRTNGQ